MHYEPRRKNHGLPHDPFTALVVPRPIGWISTVDANGTVNLAPYSFFNAIAGRPPYVMFASNSRKDTQENCEAIGEFVINVATYELRAEMNATSIPAPSGANEAALAGLETAPSSRVRPPRVLRSPVALECIVTKIVPLAARDAELPTTIIIGEVVCVFIDDAIIVDGLVDIERMAPISRLGYRDYGTVGAVFAMPRPSAADLIPG